MKNGSSAKPLRWPAKSSLMFISKKHLHHTLGIDPDIAAFFVDRKVPEGNQYWKGRYLYVASGTGYLFIPIYFDILLRSGISKEVLLDESFVHVCEQILHSAAVYESEDLDFVAHIENCREILDGKVKDPELFDDLCEYFSQGELRPYKYLGTTSKALNRGDTFLFALCCISAGNEVKKRLIEQWYALVPSFLLMDDLTDLKEDMDKNEENGVLDLGEGVAAVGAAISYLRQQFEKITLVNERLGAFFMRTLEQKMESPYFKSLLNSSYGS
jgi:hypothetical protein